MAQKIKVIDQQQISVDQTTGAQLVVGDVNLKDGSGNPITSTDGKLDISGTLVVSDIQIGAVEIKDGSSDNRQTVAADGRASTDANLQVGDTDVSNTNPVPTQSIKSIGTVSTVNSSTTPLAGGGVFTGTGEEVKDYSTISVNIFTDQNSAANGLSLQWSSDNSNWDLTEDIDVSANIARSLPLNIRARYFRIVYTNGATLQGTFRLQTIYHPHILSPLTRPLSENIPEESTASVTRTIVAGQAAGTGDYVNAQFTTAGNQKFSLEEFETGISSDSKTKLNTANFGNTVKNGTGTWLIPLLDADGHRQVDVLSSALPTGAATSTNQLPDGHNVTIDNTSANPVPVEFPETNSTDNSTTTPLGISGVFSGAWETIVGFDALDLIIFTDQNSATDGAKLMLSTDGGTTTHKTVQNTITGGVGAFLYGIPTGAYTHFKIDYTNGATAQTAFVIKIVKKKGGIAVPIAPIGATIDETLAAGLVRAIMALKKDNGTFVNLTGTDDGYVKTAVQNSIGLTALTGMTTRQITVATTATQLDAAPLSGRKTISIKLKASSTQKVYIGHSNAVTISNGYELSAGDAVDIEIDTTQAVWAIADTASQVVSVIEVS